MAPDRFPPSPALLLGAALPDLATMGRFRLLARPDDPDLAEGIELHHRTDDAFHRHPLFRSTSAAATAQLTEAGLSRGAARACGHVGVELLLDGHLLGGRSALRPSVEAAMGAASDRAVDLEDLVAPDERRRWRHHLARLAEWPVPADYHRPEAVARRLQRILDHRPRLRFPVAQVAIVAAGLDDQRDAVTAGAAALLADLRRDLIEPRG